MDTVYPELNVEMVRRVLDHVVARPETHDQANFKNQCGSAQCVAGWTLSFSNYKTKFDETSYMNWRWYDPEGWEVSPDLAAREILGLVETEATVLFFQTGNSGAVRVLGNLLSGRRGDEACGFVFGNSTAG